MSQFSTKKIGPEWMTFTEGISHKYPGFCLDKDNFFIQNKSAIQIDLQELEDLFRSKDIAKYEAVKDQWFGPTSLLLQKTDKPVVTLGTFPRSGNSMMRKHFENLTGIATGSDMVLKWYMNVALQYSGFKAEGIVNEQVWINKSHFPCRFPFDKEYNSDFALVCIRNPLDVIVSFFNMALGMTHTNTIKGDFLDEKLIKYWKTWITNNCRLYRQWHEWWLNLAENTNVPVYFFRFEDVISNKQHMFTELMSYILGMESTEGTVLEKRIQDVMNMSASKQQVYKPRSGSVNKNLEKYTKEMLEFVYKELEPIVHIFGYAKDDPNANKTNTEFFDFKGKASQTSLDKSSHYLKLNKIAWERRLKMMKDKSEFESFTINGKNDGYNVITELEMTTLSTPMDDIELIQ